MNDDERRVAHLVYMTENNWTEHLFVHCTNDTIHWTKSRRMNVPTCVRCIGIIQHLSDNQNYMSHVHAAIILDESR